MTLCKHGLDEIPAVWRRHRDRFVLVDHRERGARLWCLPGGRRATGEVHFGVVVFQLVITSILYNLWILRCFSSLVGGMMATSSLPLRWFCGGTNCNECQNCNSLFFNQVAVYSTAQCAFWVVRWPSSQKLKSKNTLIDGEKNIFEAIFPMLF